MEEGGGFFFLQHTINVPILFHDFWYVIVFVYYFSLNRDGHIHRVHKNSITTSHYLDRKTARMFYKVTLNLQDITKTLQK